MLSPIIIYMVMIHTCKTTNIHTSVTRHEFAKMYLKYNLPRIINDTPELVLEKIVTHNLRGFAYYLKKILTKISKDMYNI